MPAIYNYDYDTRIMERMTKLFGDMDDLFERVNELDYAKENEKAAYEELDSILEKIVKENRGFWMKSPSGKNHIIVINRYGFFVNIYGVRYAFDCGTWAEGEMDFDKITWIEEDNLVLISCYYVVHDFTSLLICHYSKNNFFTCDVEPDKMNFGTSMNWEESNCSLEIFCNLPLRKNEVFEKTYLINKDTSSDDSLDWFDDLDDISKNVEDDDHINQSDNAEWPDDEWD